MIYREIIYALTLQFYFGKKVAFLKFYDRFGEKSEKKKREKSDTERDRSEQIRYGHFIVVKFFYMLPIAQTCVTAIKTPNK